jgi:hypothetical protein
MAKVVAKETIRVTQGAHTIIIGTEPRDVPEFLVDACIRAGATHVEQKAAPTKSKSKSKAVPAGE